MYMSDFFLFQDPVMIIYLYSYLKNVKALVQFYREEIEK